MLKNKVLLISILLFSVSNLKSAAKIDDKNIELINAVKHDNFELLVDALSFSNINDTDSNGRTALIWAAILNNEKIAKFLFLQKNANIDHIDKDQCKFENYNKDLYRKLLSIKKREATKIIAEIRKGDLEFLQQELEKGFDINSLDYFGDTPLIAAVTSGQNEIVKYLIEKNADINILNCGQHSALLRAVQSDNTALVTLLLSRGAIIYPLDLIWSVLKNNPEIMMLLLENGAINFIEDNSLEYKNDTSKIFFDNLNKPGFENVKKSFEEYIEQRNNLNLVIQSGTPLNKDLIDIISMYTFK